MVPLSQNGVSVIVCCYNSIKRLAETLEHLSKQLVPVFIPWEIIIVDNNSSDDTASFAENKWKQLNCRTPFRVIFEQEPGLSAARKKGYQSAMYDLIIFCDDDNWLREDYIKTAYELMHAQTNIGIAGGWSGAAFEIEKPEWFDAYQNAYVVGKQLPASGYANSRRYVTGAGMVVRKAVLEQLYSIGFKSMLSDRKGNSLSSGGDSELCLLTLFLGYDLYYDERLYFTHFITKERLLWKYCVKMIAHGFAIPQIYFYLYDYCFSNAINNKPVDFAYAYKRNLRRPLKELRSLKKSSSVFSLLKSFAVSSPGSQKEILVNTNINKLLYALRNKRKLENEFSIIEALMQKIKVTRLTENRMFSNNSILQ